ncbi:MAG TPA: hypothetical protein EYO73_00095 [Sulfurimonas sp.]|nr:hypothetical protein [Sulfurimonas sp.]
MEVTRYIFKSPYSSAVQVGRPDAQASTVDNSNEAVDGFAKVGNSSLKEAQSYRSTLSSVNVAMSFTDTDLSSSLSSFRTLNGQVKANIVYTEQELF